MGVTYRFIASPKETAQIVSWFSALPQNPQIVPRNSGYAIHFSAFGPLVCDSAGTIKAEESPVVTLFEPQTRLGALWTVGEVHFLATPLRQRFPGLDKVRGALLKWFRSYPLVFSRKSPVEQDYTYFLEGSVQNRDSDIFALPEGLKELNGGRYFVSEGDNDEVLQKIKKRLVLRDVVFP